MPPATDDLGIRQHNWEAHQDIQDEIVKKRDGLFTFIIKVCSGNITDFIMFENDTALTLLNGQSNTFIPQAVRETSCQVTVRATDGISEVSEGYTRLEYA